MKQNFAELRINMEAAQDTTTYDTYELVDIPGGSVFDSQKNILFQMSSAAGKFSSIAKNVQPEELKHHIYDFNNINILKYGDSNLYPQVIRDIIELNNTLVSGIEKRAASVYSNGIITKDSEGNVKVFPEFVKFKRSHTSFASIIYQQIMDLLTFRWSPLEYFFSNDGSKILGLYARKAEQARLGWDAEKKVLDGTIWLDAQWEIYGQYVPKTAIQLPLIYESNFAVESLKERISKKSYIKTIAIPFAQNGYPKSSIQALIDMGWIDISNDEPKYIKALIQNKATVLTIIKIKDWYWEARFGMEEWQKKTPEQKRLAKKTEIKAFNDMMSGIENAGKTLIIDVKTAFLQNRAKTGQNVGRVDYDAISEAWEVSFMDVAKLDNSISAYANTARKEIMFSIGLDWMTGGGVSQENQTGGSAKQQSKNIELILDEFLRELICEQFYFIRDYNGWDPTMEFDFNLPVMQTLASMSPKDRQLKPNDKPQNDN